MFNGIIVKGIAEGQNLTVTADRSGHLYSSLYGLKARLAVDLLEFLGSTAIEDSVLVPAWKSRVRIDREKMACRADRRRL